MDEKVAADGMRIWQPVKQSTLQHYITRFDPFFLQLTPARLAAFATESLSDS